MTFAHPILVWAAVACVPVLALFFIWSWRTRRRLIAEFVPRRLQAALTLGHSPRRARTRALLLVLGTVFLMLALARPRLGATSIEVTQRGLDILVALDTSKSMLAEDAGPGISRLRRAKLAALDLARLARTDRVGLIAFAGTAFLQCPLTIDDDAFRQSVEALDVDIIPEGGTSFGPAIRTALEAHAAESRNVRVLVLFTDGEDHESSALAEAEAAKEKGLRIFTVGVGTTRGEIIRIRDSQGNPAYLKDSKGNVVKSALNESLLTEISQRTGGFYLPLQGPQVIEELFHRGLEPLPRSDLQARTIEQYDERFQIPLLLALLFLAVESLMPERARPKGAVRELPVGHPTLAQAVQSVTTLILGIWIALALLSSRASASPGSAWEDYENGRFDQALHEFERLAREHPDDPRYQFNAGAAAFRSADFERASRHFSNTLHTPDLELQRHAYYNLGNTLFSQGEGIEDMNARRGLWESSIKSLDAAMRLAPDNPNTRHNLEYVRTRLEDLKQQQQQQQKQNQKDKQEQKDPKQDENQQKQDSQDPSQDQQKQDSSEPQDSQDNQPSDPQQSEPKDSPPKDSESQAPESGNQDPQKDQNSGSPKDGEQAQKPSAPDQGQGSQGETGAADPGAEAPPGQMSPQQALRLLDTAKGEERPVPLEKRRARARVTKDW